MKRLISIGIVLLLTGCAATTSPHNHVKLIEDQNFYYPAGSDTVMVRWVRLSNDRLQKICGATTNISSNKFLGCAGLNPAGTCIIFTSTHSTHQILGHELRHCFDKDFHR